MVYFSKLENYSFREGRKIVLCKKLWSLADTNSTNIIAHEYYWNHACLGSVISSYKASDNRRDKGPLSSCRVLLKSSEPIDNL